MSPPDPKRRRRPTGKPGAPSADQQSNPVNSPCSIADQAELAFRRNVRQLHQLGPRATYELLAEIGARRLCRTEVEELVGQYAALDLDALRAVGADRMPPPPPPRLVRP